MGSGDTGAAGGGERLVPARPAGIDAARYRLDDGTRRILELVDGERDVQQIAVALRADPLQVIARLEMLGRAGLVLLAKVAAPATLADFGRPAPERADEGRAAPQAAPRPAAADDAAAWAGIAAGDLAAKPLPALLAEAAAGGLDGAIRVTRGADRITFYFAQGQPVGARSECARHELGDMLRAAGRIDEATHAAYRAAVERGADHAISALRQAGVTDKAALGALLAWHGGALLAEAARWADGRFEIAPGAAVPPRVAKVRLKYEPHAAKADWRGGPLTAAEEEFIERNQSRYLVVDPSAGRTLAAMGLGEKEVRFVRHLAQTPLQIREALAISTLYRSPTRKLIFALVESGVFALHETNPEGVSAIPVEDLHRYSEALVRDNDFNVLTLHPSSTEREIADRYRKRRAEFEDARFPSARDEHRAALAVIRARVDKAYERLKDAASRREYRASVYSPDQIDNFFDLQLRKAEVVLKMRCDPAAALEVAESALELKPGEPEATILAATALARLGRRAEAQRLFGSLKAIPGRLKADVDALNAVLRGGE